MKKQIVVSIDPMNIQQNVIDYAVELARSGEKELVLYCVQGMPLLSDADASMTSVGYRPIPGEIEEFERIATELYEMVRVNYPPTSLELGLGFQATATIGKMKEITSDGVSTGMLVMPKTSDFGWWNNVMGTAETAVATEVNCPVLFVPEGVVYEGISSIMYLADATSLADGRHKGFRFLRKFAEEHAAQVVVGFMLDTEGHDKESMKLSEEMDRFKDSLPFQINHEYRFFLHHSPEEILQTAGIIHSDIVAFPFRESTLWERFFDNDISRTLVLKAAMPVLVF